MDDQARADFLGHFQNDPKRTTLGFSVLGGIFSEGIDLTGDRLIGAIVVSVGLPKMNYISDRIQKYFGEDNPSLGYSYAYVYPGINRVFQAAGRVIRGEEDKGVILYMDTRYSYDVYKNNLEQMYPKIVSVGKSQAIISQTRAFWEKKKS
jgi:DNA excision repair protein ERCC-2